MEVTENQSLDHEDDSDDIFWDRKKNQVLLKLQLAIITQKLRSNKLSVFKLSNKFKVSLSTLYKLKKDKTNMAICSIRRRANKLSQKERDSLATTVLSFCSNQATPYTTRRFSRGALSRS
mmetsp:Transcript_1646/g.2040  ORF Transcript_1646/g.2040 Transcript_1646/m.2040 type:complete len:120 (+) Transcript_1646:371-730(+)